MNIKLSKRLKTIVDLCEPCDTIVDVGTDHGKVAITLANINISKNVIATDIRKGPLDSCKENASLYLAPIHSNIDFVLSDGLDKIDKSVETGIIIAGMGFDLIKYILRDINDYNYKYLILSPHTKITEMIKFLESKNICNTKIFTVFDDDKCYFIIKAFRT